MKKVLSKAVPIVLICIFFVMLIIVSNKKGDNHIIEEEESFYVQVPEAQRFFSTDSSFSLLPSHNEKYKVIYVFASWCPSCAKHIGLIQEVKGEYEMSVIGLSWDENQENLKEWLAKNSNPFEEIGALSSDLVMELGVSVLPAVFIIDQTSKIVYHDEGDIDETQFKNVLDKIDAVY